MATKRLNDSPKNGVPIPGIFLTIQCIKWGNPAGLQVAERQGFEPWVGLHPQRFSRPPRSTTPAPLRGGL